MQDAEPARVNERPEAVLSGHFARIKKPIKIGSGVRVRGINPRTHTQKLRAKRLVTDRRPAKQVDPPEKLSHHHPKGWRKRRKKALKRTNGGNPQTRNLKRKPTAKRAPGLFKCIQEQGIYMLSTRVCAGETPHIHTRKKLRAKRLAPDRRPAKQADPPEKLSYHHPKKGDATIRPGPQKAVNRTAKERQAVNSCPQKMLPMLDQDKTLRAALLFVLVCAWVRFSCGNC
jgi:hypothetical protein